MYDIVYGEGVAEALAELRANRRAQILGAIQTQLRHEPTRQTRNRKMLVGVRPPWEQVEPMWELRVGEYRVFYDADEVASIVVVRAVRHKPPHKTTEEIL